MRSFNMKKTVPVKLILLQSSDPELKIKHYDITFSLITTANAGDNIEEAQTNQNISYHKTVFFLEDVISGSVVFDLKSAEMVDNFASLGNNFILLPEITEFFILATLHTKINAFIEPNTVVEQMSLHSIEEDIHYDFTLVDEDCPELPKAEDWAGKYPYWPGCWWNRPDANTFDRNAQSKDEIDEWNELVEEVGLSLSFTEGFKNIEAMIRGEPMPPGELIEVDFENKKQWRPELVD